jgi:arginyl-tRNA synthetase
MLGADRKMFATRKGGALELMELLDEAARISLGEVRGEHRQAPRTRAQGVRRRPTTERREIAEVVGVGAVKYADLSQSRTTDYVFDLDKMTATDGNTAAYMQYAYARCRSILRDGGVDEAAAAGRAAGGAAVAARGADARAPIASLPGGGRGDGRRLRPAPHHRLLVGRREGAERLL